MTNLQTRLLSALSRRLPHPEPPGARYLRMVRMEPRRGPLTAALFGGVPRQVAVRDRQLPVHGGLRARVYAPRAGAHPRPLVVAFHGGGFVMGNLASLDWPCGQIAGRVGAVVVSVAYRMAPEHPAPIPQADCLAATRWLMAHADDIGADAGRTAVLGASAGGTLAALVALQVRDRVRVDASQPALRSQVLIYPLVDLTLSAPSIAELPDGPILTRPVMDWYGRRYLPQGQRDSIEAADPRVSPLFAADHRDLPPALLIAGGRDPLRDDATRYADVLRAAGVPATVRSYAEAIHGFVSMPRLQPDARPAVEAIVTELAARLR